MIRSPFKVLLLALACTWAFFFEYIPPFRWVHIPYDLEGYHHSLANYAFQQLKEFRLPQWDPSMYSGMSYISNVQSALFYPLTWVMFLLKWGNERLSYQALQDLQFFHVALGFTLCYVWLNRKFNQSLPEDQQQPMAAVFGAAVFAYSGYVTVQLQHFGLLTAYVWMPLGFLGIDEAVDRGSQPGWWKPMWKVVVASAMAFLGGYPPTWLSFAVAAGTYALIRPNRLRTVPATVFAFAFSLLVCAIQVLPAWDATHFREPEMRYGLGIKEPIYWMAYLAPNFFDFGLDVNVFTNLGKENFYLGAPGLLGIVLALFSPLFFKKSWRPILPALGVVVVTLILVINPYDIVWDRIKNSPLLYDLMRSYYFLAGTGIALAELSGHGLHAFLTRPSKPKPLWLLALVLLLMGTWSAFELVRWWPANFAHGWAALFDPGMMLLIFIPALFVFRSLSGDVRTWMAVALLIFVGVDYKVFGTSKRYDATLGDFVHYSSTEFGAMATPTYAKLRPAPGESMMDYRILQRELGPPPTIMRHVQWTSPQGFDPFLSIPYRELGAKYGEWNGDRGLKLDPLRRDTLDVFAVRFVVTAEADEKYAALQADPDFVQLGDPVDGYYKVFEYKKAVPLYRFDASVTDGSIEIQKRVPEHRVLRVKSSQGGPLRWAENAYPGWSASIDGKPVTIGEWEGTFQQITVPPGEHTVEFVYQERLLNLGAAITVASMLVLIWWIRAARVSEVH